MEETTILEIALIRAKNISEFCREDGRRNLHFHYYQWLPEEKRWLMRWIEEDTEGDWLIDQIQKGLLYIHDYTNG